MQNTKVSALEKESADSQEGQVGFYFVLDLFDLFRKTHELVASFVRQLFIAGYAEHSGFIAARLADVAENKANERIILDVTAKRH